jgi:putative SOS response-associated peptidase YedK
MWVYLKTREPFGLAGLWDAWRSPSGKRVESFTIITTEPNELIRPIHNRMPVILRQEDEEAWLDVFRTSFAKAGSFLKPYPDELMAAHDVSTVVIRRSTKARNAPSLCQMTTNQVVSCPYCDDDFY